jgi:hypothetical protein
MIFYRKMGTVPSKNICPSSDKQCSDIVNDRMVVKSGLLPDKEHRLGFFDKPLGNGSTKFFGGKYRRTQEVPPKPALYGHWLPANARHSRNRRRRAVCKLRS